MTAWQILTGNSTLPSGTAWQHLNNQQGGNGGEPIYIERLHTIYGERVIQLMSDYEVSLEGEDIVVEVETDFDVELIKEFKVKP